VQRSGQVPDLLAAMRSERVSDQVQSVTVGAVWQFA
jgi:hypothetical protein